MRAATWKQLTLKDLYYRICSLNIPGMTLLTHPGVAEKTETIERYLKSKSLDCKIYDITNKDSISDRDLQFLLRKLGIAFEENIDNNNYYYEIGGAARTTYEFRKKILDGKLSSPLPYLLRNGNLLARLNVEKQCWDVVAGMFAVRHLHIQDFELGDLEESD